MVISIFFATEKSKNHVNLAKKLNILLKASINVDSLKLVFTKEIKGMLRLEIYITYMRKRFTKRRMLYT